MPINLNKARNAIEKYRTAHTLLHENPVPRLSEAHDPLTFAMRDTLQKWGFNHEGDVFEYSDNEVLTALGYSSRLDFFNAVYDVDGNVISGKEGDHNTWEARFK
jgi:hypothetical protein